MEGIYFEIKKLNNKNKNYKLLNNINCKTQWCWYLEAAIVKGESERERERNVKFKKKYLFIKMK